MAKTLKQMMEVYAPKSKDEKRFKDKHVVAKYKLDEPSKQDKVFDGSNVKDIDREGTRHGYNPGNDEKVYEQHDYTDGKNGTKEIIHPKAIVVKPVKVNGKTKYKVHKVGKEFSDGIKVGEHLSDTDLDDASEMGAKVYHRKADVKEETLGEKKLTPAEMKKREQVAKALKRENPNMPMAKKMAIATATAKRVAEEECLEIARIILEYKGLNENNLTEYFEKEHIGSSKNYHVYSVNPEDAEYEIIHKKTGNKTSINVEDDYPNNTTRKIKRELRHYKSVPSSDLHSVARHINKHLQGDTAGEDRRFMKEEDLYESEDSHKAFQDHHNKAAKTIKDITKTLSDHYNTVTNKNQYNKGEAQWHHVSAIKNINRQLEDLQQMVAQEVDYSRPPKPISMKEGIQLDDEGLELLNIVYDSLTDENKAVLEDIIENNPDQLVEFLDQLEVDNG